jgi:phenylalanyl-tRNA synthetase beta chain
MKFPESWLREFCDPPLSTHALAELLTMSGLEVESLAPVAPPFSGVVVGEILSAEPHPQADRLRVCRVDVGRGEPLQIVCGAPNARAGLKAPLAMVGAELPPAADAKDGAPFRIGLGRLRGVESAGMLCSARELGIAEDHGGLLELDAAAPVGTSIRDWLRLDDHVFELKLTPNLAHALSVYGIAREVAALTGAPLKTPAFPPVPPSSDRVLPVRVEAPELCGRFSGRVVTGVDTRAKTPAWMVERLARCGQRSVTSLVDISNYVMFEFGRPSHIFDLDKIHHGLCVRWGRPGERLELLNGSTVELDAQVGVIADAAPGQAGQVESLAGIMGGEATAVSDATGAIYIEAAFWWPESVQGRGRRYGFATDAGHRFERGVDPAQTVEHIERITQLVLDICGTDQTRVGPMSDQVLALPQRAPVALRVERACRVLGMPVTAAECAGVFERLGLPFTQADGVLTVTPPPYRFDLAIEEDLIEEVARVLGYQRLPATPPVAPVVPRVRPEAQRGGYALRRHLAEAGFQETIGFSFVEAAWERDLAGNDDPIRVLNPIAAPLAVMRSSLLGSLLQVLKTNLARRAGRVRVFEVGRVFLRDPSAPDGPVAVAGVRQPMRVAALAWGTADPLQWGLPERPVDFFDLKGTLESLLAPRPASFVPAEHPAMHPGRCAAVQLDGATVGHIGELHPRWRQAWELPSAPMLFELEIEALTTLATPEFAPLPRQQTVQRDLALVVAESVRHDALLDSLRADPEGLVQQATLFDVYRPREPQPGLAAGEHSLAMRLSLLDPEATLTDERIDAAVAAAVARAAAAVGARLRG